MSTDVIKIAEKDGLIKKINLELENKNQLIQDLKNQLLKFMNVKNLPQDSYHDFE